MSPDHRRSELLVRMLDLVNLLAQEALTLEQIAARMGVCQRTVRRDIYALQRAGIDFVNLAATDDVDDGDEWPIAAGGRSGVASVLKLDARSWTGLLYRPAA